MFRTLLTRRLVTGISVVMLLLCQTAAATLVYAAASPVAPAPTAGMDGVAPCHHEADAADNSTPARGCQDRCPSRAASFETAKFDIPAAGVVALAAYAVAAPHTAATVAGWGAPIPARAAPPPLRLVYCRLLN